MTLSIGIGSFQTLYLYSLLVNSFNVNLFVDFFPSDNNGYHAERSTGVVLGRRVESAFTTVIKADSSISLHSSYVVFSLRSDQNDSLEYPCP